MKVLVRAIVTGFGLSVGAYVFRKLSTRYNLEPAATPAPPITVSPDSSMQREPS
jgi:hypothetical protein